jgi:hypothetical protein
MSESAAVLVKETSTAIIMIVHVRAGLLGHFLWSRVVCGGMEVEKDVDTNIDSPKEGVGKS